MLELWTAPTSLVPPSKSDFVAEWCFGATCLQALLIEMLLKVRRVVMKCLHPKEVIRGSLPRFSALALVWPVPAPQTSGSDAIHNALILPHVSPLILELSLVPMPHL